MAKTISKESRAKIMSAVELTADFVNAGDDPNQAIAKAAKDAGLGPGYVDVMVHAYNTGRANKQRAAGNTLLEKAADFDMADVQKVLDILYPDAVKSAAQVRQSQVVSDEYSRSPRTLFERRRQAAAVKAAAIDIRKLPDGSSITAPEPRRLDTSYEKMASKVSKLNREIAECRRQMQADFDKAAQAYARLADYFRGPEAVSFEYARKQANLMHGAVADSVFSQLESAMPNLPKLRKHSTKTASWHEEPFGAVDQVIAAVSQYNKSRAKYESTKQANDKAIEEARRPFSDGDYGPSGSILGGPVSSTKQGSMLAPAALAAGTVSSLKNVLSPPDGDKAVQSVLSDIADPAHEDQLRQIKTRAMLQELLADDEVISQYPDEAVSAFNEIVETMPRAADQKMLMRALLRQRLEQGAVDPFQIDQMMGMEEKLRKRDNMPALLSQHGAPGSPPGEN